MLGDLNLPNMNWNLYISNSDQINALLKLLLQKYAFSQLINFLTKGLNILDVLLYNNISIIHDIQNLPPVGNSDHSSFKFSFLIMKNIEFNKFIFNN